MKYLMLDVDAIVKLVLRAEEVIRKDENFHEIVTALRELSKIERIIIGNNNFNIDMNIIKHLNHLGTIFLTKWRENDIAHRYKGNLRYIIEFGIRTRLEDNKIVNCISTFL